MKNSEILSEEEIKFSDEIEELVGELAEGNTTVMLAYGEGDGEKVIVRVRNLNGAVDHVSIFRTLFIAVNDAAEGFMDAITEGREPDEKDLKIISLYKATKEVIEEVIMPVSEMMESGDERTIH